MISGVMLTYRKDPYPRAGIGRETVSMRLWRVRDKKPRRVHTLIGVDLPAPFPHEGVHLARPELEGDPIKGKGTRKRFGYLMRF